MNRLVALISAVALLALGGFVFMGRSAPLPVNPLIGAADASTTQEADSVSIPDMVLGDETAPVTMIEYASYTCPHCAHFHNDVFKQLKADYIDTGKVKFVFREVYFDRYGLWASMIARCGGPEKFFGITGLIFEGQDSWVRAGGPSEIVGELRKIGRLAGIPKDEIEACLQNEDEARALIAWYQKNAEADQIKGTPTFIINGELVTNRPYDELKQVLDAKLGN